MGQTIHITEELHGKRADIVATMALPSLSRAYVHKLFEEGRITLDHSPLKPGHRLRTGEKLRIDFDPKVLEQIPDIELPILYEDDDVLVVDKPAGVISHARGKYWNEPSVASFVRQKTGQEGERAGIVHRLDRVTSGVMVCAKHAQALSFLQKQFSNRTVRKSYVAVIGGHLKEAEAVIEMPIARHPTKPKSFYVTASGKPATTHYQVAKRLEKHDIVRLEPKTGRTHQLRVHLKELGHPIVGDDLYGGEPAERLYLHAVSLELTLPSGSRKIFDSPLPAEFSSFEARHAV